MKVVQVDFERTLRGGQKQVIYLIEGLVEKGVECILICKKNSKLHDYAKENKLKFHALSVHGECDFFAMRKLRKIIQEYSPDIVHFHSGHAHTIGYLAIRKILEVVSIATRRVHYGIKRNPITWRKYNEVNKVVCVSKFIMNGLKSYGVPAEKLELIYSGVKLEKARTDISYLEREFKTGGKIRLGMLAAMTSGDKDYITLLDALKILKTRTDNFIALAVGEGPELKKYKNYAKNIGVEDKIIFTGFRKDTAEILSFLDIYVHSARIEPLGTAVIEAMTSGLPIVATACGGIPELIIDGENGLLVKPSSPVEFADKIFQLIKDEGKRTAISKNNVERAKLFSDERMVENNLNLYKRLLNKEE